MKGQYMTLNGVSLFSGAGGMHLGAKALGFDMVGFEINQAACLTREAAGLKTIQGDLRRWGPLDVHPMPNLLTAGPPCQTYTIAGSGKGRQELDLVTNLLLDMVLKFIMNNRQWDARIMAPKYETFSDERTGLILEPMRWILEAMHHDHPITAIALEQVPTALPVWEAYEGCLRQLGYNTASGVVSAEQYGVPQTRRRAILIANLHHEVKLPVPTHSRYHSQDRNRLDPGVAKWRTIQDALGEEVAGKAFIPSHQGYAAVRFTDEPSGTVAFGHDIASARFVEVLEGFGPEDLAELRAMARGLSAERITIQQAGALQSFPVDYPWQGGIRAASLQIGNAVPPLLAQHVITAALGGVAPNQMEEM